MSYFRRIEVEKTVASPLVKFLEGFLDDSIDEVNNWSWAKSGSATNVIVDNVLTLGVTTSASDYVTYNTLPRFYSEDGILMFKAWINFSNASHLNNKREFGAISNDSYDGFFFRLTNSQFSVVIKKNNSESPTSLTFALDNKWHLFEIYILNKYQVQFLIDSNVVSEQFATTETLVNDNLLDVYFGNINTGIIASGLNLLISDIAVVDSASSKINFSGRDDTYRSRDVLSDKAGRLVTIYPSIQGALNTLNYPNTSIAPYVINLWRKVLAYHIPAGYIFNLLKFNASSATANYPSRIVREMYLGRYTINTNVYTIGNSYSNLVPDYVSTVEAEVTTQIAGAVTLTITYVNQSGTGGRTGTVVLTSGDVIGVKRPVTLQVGDIGVKSITACARSATVNGAVYFYGIDELSYIYNNTANVPLESNFLPTGLYIPGGVGGDINLEITASSLTATVRKVSALHSLFLKTSMY